MRWLGWHPRQAFAVWTGMGLFLGLVFLVSDLLAGVPTNLWDMLLLGTLCAWVWAVIRPAVTALGRRYPPEGLWLAGHLVASVLFAVILSVVMVMMFWITRPLIGGAFPTIKVAFSGVVQYFFLAEVLFYWVVIAADAAFTWSQRYRAEEVRLAQAQQALTQTRLLALERQLRPHFLFNTFNGIASLIRDEKKTEALDTLVDLGDLLRQFLHGDQNPLTTLEGELHLVQRYLAIERRRFGARLKFKVNLENGVEPLLIPRFLLQTLVENVVKHALEADSDCGEIHVTIWRRSDFLEISVVDDGPGLKSDWQEKREERVGLRNLKSRLQQLYGRGANLQLEPRTLGGVVATVHLPVSEPAS